MKKVFLDDLPRWTEGKNEGKINWEASIGYDVPFVYDDINGTLIISDYKDRYLIINYEGNQIDIHIANLTQCRIGRLLGKRNKDHKFCLGEVVNDKIKIIKLIKIKAKNEKINRKGYEYKCLTCGNVDTIDEGNLNKGMGCNVCSNKKVMIGYNDIWTTNPKLAELFVDPNDGYVYTKSTDYRADFKCPNCDFIIKDKLIKDVGRRGLSCPCCSDGISYPEKVMSNVLSQLKIEFEYQKTFNWLNNKKYDFYIPSLSCIIETHGRQHYEQLDYFGGIEKATDNDNLKEDIALINEIKHYIVLDCRRSELEWVKNSIINSKINDFFDLSNVDWFQCHEYACDSLVKKVCDLWSFGITTLEIANRFNIHRGTVVKYLKKGCKVGLCSYDVTEVQKISGKRLSKVLLKREVVRLNLKNEFIDEYLSIKDASSQTGTDRGGITNVCKGKLKTSGGFKWMYKEDYLKHLSV